MQDVLTAAIPTPSIKSATTPIDTRCSDKVRVDGGSGWVGSWCFGRQGESERFR